MRKSAVSVRSGAGMPAHMAGEEGRCKEKKGRDSVTQYMSLHYIWEDTQQMSLQKHSVQLGCISTVVYGLNMNILKEESFTSAVLQQR